MSEQGFRVHAQGFVVTVDALEHSAAAELVLWMIDSERRTCPPLGVLLTSPEQ